jgi:uncharacterized protein (TIGR03437 family)
MSKSIAYCLGILSLLTAPLAIGALSINPGGVVNAASSAPGAVAPGSIVSAYGSFSLGAPSQAGGVPLPVSLSGLSMRFGGMPTPLYYASSGQVNLQAPWELAGQTQTTLTAALGSQTSVAQTVNLAPFAPGIFSMNGQGTGPGAILDSQYRLVGSSNPASVGDVVQIYCTGLGAVTNQPASGFPAPFSPRAETTTTPVVAIGGTSAQVLYSGLTPGSVGLYQINAQVPSGIATGPAVPIVVSIGGVASNTVTVAIQPFPSSPVVRYVAVAATSRSIDTLGGGVPGALYIYDRDTLALLGQVPVSDLSGPYNPSTAITSPDGGTIYVAVKGPSNELVVVDAPSAAEKARIPLPREVSSLTWATGAGGVQRILANAFELGVVAIDPSKNAVVDTLPCPGSARSLLYDPANLTTYVSEYGRAELCTITPSFTAGSPIALPAMPPNGVPVLLDNGEQGVIVAGDPSVVLDLRNSGIRIYQSHPFSNYLMIGAASPDRRSVYFYAWSGGARYGLTFAADGTPRFAQEATGQLGSLTAVDDRFLYTASITGSCTSPESIFSCPTGVMILDPETLQPRPGANTIALDQQVVAIVAGSYATPAPAR